MADKTYRILVINPGSTSTKVGVFDGETEVFTKNVAHEAEKLAEFSSVSDQMPYRRDLILEALSENDVDLSTIDAFVGRGGGLLALEGGTYAVNDVMLDHAYRGANGVQHPAQLGSQLANAFATQVGKPAFVVNPPDTDELCDLARMTGIKGVYRNVHLHALNLKETAIRHAHSMGKRYDECNFIVCHIDGGISVTAHEKGRMIDGNNAAGGEGPFTPTRMGGMAVTDVVEHLSRKTPAELLQLCTEGGGFSSHFGTSNADEVHRRIEAGDEYAKLVWDAMVYQICKEIGAMAAVLYGQVDDIVLTGGLL